MGGILALLVLSAIVASGGKKGARGLKEASLIPMGGTTRPGHTPDGRAFTAAPEPGFWYEIKEADLKPVMVKGPQGSISGVALDRPDHAFAWRAYVGVSHPKPNKKRDVSRWGGLAGILGPREGVSDAVALTDEVVGATQAGVGGDWVGLGQQVAGIIKQAWDGIRERQDAAVAAVSDSVLAFTYNIAGSPDNADQYTEDPTFVVGLNLQPGDQVYIPLGGEFYSPQPSKPG